MAAGGIGKSAGKYADLLVIDRDVMTVDPAQILGTLVQLAVVGGEIVYERRGESEKQETKR